MKSTIMRMKVYIEEFRVLGRWADNPRAHLMRPISVSAYQLPQICK